MLKLDWTSASNGALLLVLRAPSRRPVTDPRVAGLCGVEVVRRMASPISEVPMAKSPVKSQSSSKSPKTRRSSKQATSQARRSRTGTTKHARVLAMLRSKGGATVAAIARTTGWQPHSVRGFLAGVIKKKLRLNLASEKTKLGRIYRVVETEPCQTARPHAAVEPPDA